MFFICDFLRNWNFYISLSLHLMSPHFFSLRFHFLLAHRNIKKITKKNFNSSRQWKSHKYPLENSFSARFFFSSSRFVWNWKKCEWVKAKKYKKHKKKLENEIKIRTFYSFSFLCALRFYIFFILFYFCTKQVKRNLGQHQHRLNS